MNEKVIHEMKKSTQKSILKCEYIQKSPLKNVIYSCIKINDCV